jgi:hypothetical protein
MPDKAQQKHRTNRVFKSLHKPLTYGSSSGLNVQSVPNSFAMS